MVKYTQTIRWQRIRWLSNGLKRATVNEVMYYLNGYFDITVINFEVYQVKT